ncbi:histidine phosphatase superfamily protein (branch 1) [Hoeflea halophila]|uniref:Histidine phosphatase superfamily protein (Branch 1) n=1 Tax=Hoeflea halophila TaxID=714899 RepID=A0A286IAQ4_9HYPH|nr:histidine phosphatase family protein [Hoeflea halophila]SOE16696.1 histidine phosphatase superfamily protein (branch 1) [Hoeflea halophila]
MNLNLRRWPAALILAVALFAVAPIKQSAATEAAWARLAQGGYTILLGYARTPGGEPLRPDLGDCENRKSLTDRGIQEARRIGMRFAARAVAISAVYSGEFCRALETAQLAFGRSNVETAPFLNSIVDGADPAIIPPELIVAVEEFFGAGNQLMVTHPALIAAISGSVPRKGEAVIIAPGLEPGDKPRVVNRLLLD